MRRSFLVATLVGGSLALPPFAASDVRGVSGRGDGRGNGVSEMTAVSRGPRGELLEHQLITARPSRGSVVRSRAVRRPPAPPVPIRNQGYRRVFTDDFNVFSRRVWTNKIWYEGDPPPGAIFTRNSVLHLVSRRDQGYRNIGITTLNAGGGTRAFHRGYFEARMRWTKGNGAWPAFWLLSRTHATNPKWPVAACPLPTCLSAEIDVFEGQGAEPNAFYGTIHRNSCCYDTADAINSNNRAALSTDLSAAWHVYALRWTAGEVRWYLDGREVMRAPTFDSTNQDMFLLFDMNTGGWTRGIGATTPQVLQTEVDWVRVWRKT
jgi:hypothetical protein